MWWGATAAAPATPSRSIVPVVAQGCRRLSLCEWHADRLRPSGRHRHARRNARHGRLGHQPRRQHGRRHHLLGHRGRPPKAFSWVCRPSPSRWWRRRVRFQRGGAHRPQNWSSASSATRSRQPRCSTSMCPICPTTRSGVQVTRLGKRHKAEPTIKSLTRATKPSIGLAPPAGAGCGRRHPIFTLWPTATCHAACRSI